jgi:aspartate racemase
MYAKKNLGIVGGMGSVAASYFFNRLVQLTPALTDQDYIETFIHNNVAVPDRTLGILGKGKSPLDELNRSVSILSKMGADYIIFACMTSHFFIPEIEKFHTNVNIINGISETVHYIQKNYPIVRKTGILASTGAIMTRIFQEALESVGLEPIILNEQDQKYCFMEPIYADWGIKAGNVGEKTKKRIQNGLQILSDSGAEVIIAGCSELPLVVHPEMVKIPIVDSIDVMLNVAIKKCLPI